MRTKYRVHPHLVRVEDNPIGLSSKVFRPFPEPHFRLDQRKRSPHGHTMLEFYGPTKVGARCNNPGCSLTNGYRWWPSAQGRSSRALWQLLTVIALRNCPSLRTTGP